MVPIPKASHGIFGKAVGDHVNVLSMHCAPDDFDGQWGAKVAVDEDDDEAGGRLRRQRRLELCVSLGLSGPMAMSACNPAGA